MKYFVLLILSSLVLMQCTSSPRYGENKSYPTKKSKAKTKITLKTGSKLIPVTKNPTLSYKKTWVGIASWYGDAFHGKLTANGEIYNMDDMTAAHKTLPLGTIVKVTNLANGKSCKVKINDRGPYIEGRMIDLSRAAAKKLDYAHLGTTKVRLNIIKFGDNKYKKQ